MSSLKFQVCRPTKKDFFLFLLFARLHRSEAPESSGPSSPPRRRGVPWYWSVRRATGKEDGARRKASAEVRRHKCPAELDGWRSRTRSVGPEKERASKKATVEVRRERRPSTARQRAEPAVEVQSSESRAPGAMADGKWMPTSRLDCKSPILGSPAAMADGRRQDVFFLAQAVAQILLIMSLERWSRMGNYLTQLRLLHKF